MWHEPAQHMPEVDLDWSGIATRFAADLESPRRLGSSLLIQNSVTVEHNADGVGQLKTPYMSHVHVTTVVRTDAMSYSPSAVEHRGQLWQRVIQV